jgi:hypothetical protein
MLAIPLLGNMVGNTFRKRYSKVLSGFIIILGIIFILRGLSLGIPYISPGEKMLVPHEKGMKMSGKNQENDTTARMGGCCGSD